jgi:hypothetical protein
VGSKRTSDRAGSRHFSGVTLGKRQRGRDERIV